MPKKELSIPQDALRAAAGVARESGVPLDDIVSATVRRMKETHTRVKASKGKFRVVGIDKFEGSDWSYDEYDSAEKAVREARRLTNKAKGSASSYDCATVYYAYDDKGNYLGGDSWISE